MRLHYLDEGGQGFPICFTEPLLDLHHVHFTAGHNHTSEGAFISAQALQAQSKMQQRLQWLICVIGVIMR